MITGSAPYYQTIVQNAFKKVKIHKEPYHGKKLPPGSISPEMVNNPLAVMAGLKI